MPGSERWGGGELLYGSRPGAVLPAVPLTEHHGRCEEHDLQVLDRRAMADVLEIVVELLPDVFHAAIVRQVDLGPAGDPRQDALAPLVFLSLRAQLGKDRGDRKSTRLNSSHANISYAVFCLKKKKQFSGSRL